jgi:hypothetical protein
MRGVRKKIEPCNLDVRLVEFAGGVSRTKQLLCERVNALVAAAPALRTAGAYVYRGRVSCCGMRG